MHKPSNPIINTISPNMIKFNGLIARIMGIDAIRRQSIVSFIWQVALTFFGFLSTMYFAHSVGPEVLGGYFLFVAYFNIIGLISDGGFGGAAIKRISEGEEQNEYFSSFIALRSVFVIIVIIGLIIFRRYFVDLNNAGTFTWLLISLIALLLYGAVSYGVAGCGKMGIRSTAGFIENISRIIIQVIAVFMGYEVAGLAGGFVLGLLAGTIVQLRFLNLRFVHFELRHLKNLASFSFWSFLVTGGMMVFTYTDTLMISYYMGNTDVGIYRIIFQFATFATFTTTALRSTLLPRVSRWSKIGETELIEKSLSTAFTYSLIIAVPFFIGGVLFGDRLLYFFYGANFVDYTTLVILFAVQIVNIFQYFFSTYLTAIDQLKELFKVTIITVTANIALNAALIPMIGISGAAIATIVTMSINAFLAWRVLSKIIIVQVDFNSLTNILKATGVMTLFIGGYRVAMPLSNVWSALVLVFLGAIVYGLFLLKFDSKIYDEFKRIAIQMNVVWPK